MAFNKSGGDKGNYGKFSNNGGNKSGYKGGYNSDRSDKPAYGSKPQSGYKGGYKGGFNSDRSDKPAYGGKPQSGYKGGYKGGFNSDRSDKPAYGGKPQSGYKGGFNSDRSDKPAYGKPKFNDCYNKREQRPDRYAAKSDELHPLRRDAEALETEENLFENILEGRNPVKEAIKAGREIDRILYASGDGAAREIAKSAKDKGVLVQETERVHLDKISKTGVHQGIIAFVAVKEYCEVSDILEYAKSRGEDPYVLILDGITDPQNLGSILRSAECAGIHGVIIPKRRAVGLTPVVAKASAGAVEYMRVAKVNNLSQTLEQLKREGLWIFGAAADGESYVKTNLRGPVGIVIGSEGDGISQNLRTHCDRMIAIPLLGKIESLNAGVAAAIIVYEGLRQRSDKSQGERNA